MTCVAAALDGATGLAVKTVGRALITILATYDDGVSIYLFICTRRHRGIVSAMCIAHSFSLTCELFIRRTA